MIRQARDSHGNILWLKIRPSGYEFKCLLQYFLNFNVQRNDLEDLVQTQTLMQEGGSVALTVAEHTCQSGWGIATLAEGCMYP